MTDPTQTVSVERRYAADPAAVWDALTTPARLARWLGTVDGDLSPGTPIDLAITGTGEQVRVVVTRCEPAELLEAEWTVDDDTSVVRATLTPDDGGGTLVVLTETGVPTSMLEAYTRGWTAHLVRLEADLTGSPLPEWAEAAAVSR